MWVLVKDASTVVVDAPAGATVLELKQLWTLKVFGVTSTVSWALSYEGRSLPDSITLEEAGLSDGAPLCASLRLRGGGGDGGSTGAESRSCYLEMYQGKKPDKVNPAEELLARWTRCHLSGEPLAEPCVVDELGSIFNKEAIVHALLNRTMPPALAHITSLKQLTTLKLDPVPRKAVAIGASANGGAKNGKAAGGNGNGISSGDGGADWQCPVTGLEMNGRARFLVHRPTGTVLSERALKEAKAAVEELLGGPWTAEDLIQVNPVGDELQKAKEQLAAKLAAERQRRLAKKLAKKGAAAGEPVEAGAAAPAAAPAAAGAAAGVTAVRSGSPGGSGSGGEPGAGNKRSVTALAAAAAAAGGVEKAAKKLKVPDNATADVYKSIFHTAEQAAAQKETYACRAVSGRWRC